MSQLEAWQGDWSYWNTMPLGVTGWILETNGNNHVLAVQRVQLWTFRIVRIHLPPSVSLWDLFDTAYFQMKYIVPRLHLRAYLLSRLLPWHSRKSLPLLHAHFSVLVSGDIREAG